MTSKPRILCVASGRTRELLASALPDAQIVEHRACLVEHLAAGAFDCVVITVPADPAEAVEAVREVRSAGGNVPVIVAAHSGSYDLLAPMLGDLDSVECLSIDNLTAMDVETAVERLRDRLPEVFPGVVGASTAMRQVFEIARLIAARRSTVLITGETGTGKEVVAQAIHQSSPRHQRPLVAVNCAAIPDTLVEAELFGYVKGAFTGAAGNRVGRFEQANGSTIFLDEISELPLDVQAKLLRVLQEREIQRLGSSETLSVDVRVVAAANVDLLEAVEQGRFRADLYYRLNVVPIRLPAVRERAGDIPLLIRHFLKQFCVHEGLAHKTVSPAAMQKLCSYPWHGNVRQIEHAVEMAVALSGDRAVLIFEDFHLPRSISPGAMPDVLVPQSGISFDNTIENLERSLIEQALKLTRGNRGRAADLLRLKRTTLLAKMKVLGMADLRAEAAA